MHENSNPKIDPELLDRCMRYCTDCFQFCNSCISHCLIRGGKYAEAKHISVMQECASMCGMSMTYMPLLDRFTVESCKLCAFICEICAKSCDGVDPEDMMMQRCAEFSIKCSETCKTLATELEKNLKE